MEAFVTKKRQRRHSPPPAEEEDSTELKLAILASLHPSLSQDILLDALLSSDGDISLASAGISGATSSPPPLKRHKSIGVQSSLASTFELPSADATQIRPLTKKGQTLHLFSPLDVESHTPCSIIHNFLPSAQADSLLRELLAESPGFSRASFQMFERTVTSPHSFAFYVDDPAAHNANYYSYNGQKMLDTRPLLPEMLKARDAVAAAVNDEVARRIRDFYPNGRKLRFQHPGPWKANACFVNCYTGAKESVGYHADQLTYVGPRTVIGSLSLGVEREFRVRHGSEGAVAVHLPHNSLLVMHAEMQEEWKHAVHPAQSIDHHPLAGDKRINITYRFYRDEFHPRFTPKCRCKVPACLRTVIKGENKGRYMWVCDSRYDPEGNECGFFEWAEFDDDGRPVWKRKQEDG